MRCRTVGWLSTFMARRSSNKKRHGDLPVVGEKIGFCLAQTKMS